MWGDTGRYPLLFNALKLAIDYYDRINKLSENTLVKKSYMEQEKLKLDWYVNVTALIEHFGKGKCNRPSINVDENLKSEFHKFWENNKATSPKLEFYNSIKSEIKREEYLKIKKFSHRSATTKLRISAHKLKIETGRYTVPITPRNQRTCDYCKNILQYDIVEDELHAISSCPSYIMPCNKFHKSIDESISILVV